MQRNKAAHVAGVYPELLAEEIPQPPLAEETTTEPPQGVYAASNEAYIAARPAELATSGVTPGLTERGWSAEVTARHPQMLADTMEELAGGTASVDSLEPIDASDPAALELARAELGFVEVLKNNLKVAATNLNSDRLGAAQDQIAMSTSAARVAAEQAAEELRGTADRASGAAQAAKPSTTSTTRSTTRK